MSKIVVPYLLSGGGDVCRFVVPIEAHEWLKTIEPGSYKIPDNIIEILRPFAWNEQGFNEFVRMEHLATTGSCDNDVALMLASLLHNYDTTRDQNQDVILNEWTLSEEDYVGVIY